MQGLVRRALSGLCLLAAFGLAAPASARTVLVANPRADAELAPLSRGAGLWLARRLHAAGLSAEPALPGLETDLGALTTYAAQQGVDYAISTELRRREANVQVRLLLHPPGRPEVLAAASGSAPLAQIGDAFESAAGGLLVRLGLDAAAGRGPVPLLDELAAASRALARLERGELQRAYREVEGRLSPTAIALREDIVAAARRPDGPAAERARVLAAAGDAASAWGLLAATPDAAAPAPRLLVARAEVQLARGDARGALDTLARLPAEAADDPDAALAAGLAHAALGAGPAAREALERAAQLDPDSPRALAALERVDASDPAARARVLLALGAREAARFDVYRAERALGRAVELDPAVSGAAWRERARLETRVGRPAQALAAWRQAEAAGPVDAEVWTGIGRSRRALGDSGAAADLEKAVALEPTRADALTELGWAQLDQGQPDRAAATLQRAVALVPGRPEPVHGLAQALRATGQPEAALVALTDADDPELLREAAAIQRELGDAEAARASLRRAAALAPWEPDLLGELAEAEAEAGDAPAAAAARELAAVLTDAEIETAAPEEAGGAAPEASRFDEFVIGFSSQTPNAGERRVAHLGIRRTSTWRSLARDWLHPRQLDVAALAASLDEALALRFAMTRPPPTESPLVLETIDRLYAYADPASLSAEAIADVNASLDTDAVFVTRLEPTHPDAADPAAPASCAEPDHVKLETRMLSGRDADVVSILYAVECVPASAAANLVWNTRALAIYGVLALLALVRLVSGWGTLVVSIELPPRTRGFLHIRIGSKPQQIGEARKKAGRNEGRLRRSLRSFSRFERHMASRETVFRWIPARKRPYFVTVRGPLYDAMGGQEIGRFLEEQTVKVERRRVARLTYDFDPDEVALQVSVTFGGEPVRGARLALREDPNSLRYARDGSVFFYVGKGAHTVCAGSTDRATERAVEVAALGQALSVQIDLSDEAGLLVQDCPAAVEPYLLGDFATAAEALAAAGQTRLADLMRGAHHQQRGETDAAAAAYEAAGFIEEAAQLRASSADHGGSAELYERAGDASHAAEAYRAAGRFADAARCYEDAYDYHNAIECWEAVGDAERVIDLRQKLGEYLDAARLAVETDRLDAALHALQQIERRDPSYPEACRLMADVLERRGEFELAAERQSQAVELAGAERAPVALHERLAELLLRANDKQRALAALETVRRLDPSRAEVTRHIEALRQELSAVPAPRAAGGASRYELLEELGRGGMGVVYKARDTRLGRIVALKRLPDELRDNQTAARLFLREAQAAAALNHRNIVTVYDAGEENGVYHITMELLEGMPLNRIQDQRGRLGARDVARLAIQVCAGLQYAHAQRIVHRDIKTANLFFTRDKVVKIMDFGLAKTIEEVRRNSTVIGGTPYYMAPEQAAGEPVDHRTDLYAFGVTCFRLLTGEFPFRDGDLVHHHRHTPAPDPRQWVSDLPAGVAEVVLQMLAKRPDERPTDADDVAARLRAAFEAR